MHKKKHFTDISEKVMKILRRYRSSVYTRVRGKVLGLTKIISWNVMKLWLVLNSPPCAYTLRVWMLQWLDPIVQERTSTSEAHIHTHIYIYIYIYIYIHTHTHTLVYAHVFGSVLSKKSQGIGNFDLRRKFDYICITWLCIGNPP